MPTPDPVAANRQELPPDHPIRRRVEAGSAAAHAAMPSVRLHLPDQEVPMMVFDETQMPDNPTWHDLLGALERSGFNRAAVLLESWADEYLNDLDSPLRGDDE